MSYSREKWNEYYREENGKQAEGFADLGLPAGLTNESYKKVADYYENNSSEAVVEKTTNYIFKISGPIKNVKL